MWPFKSVQKPSTDLEERQERLERKVRDLTTDWDQTYEKFAKLHARMVKRIKDEEKRREDAPESANGTQPDREVNPLAARLLNPYGAHR